MPAQRPIAADGSSMNIEQTQQFFAQIGNIEHVLRARHSDIKKSHLVFVQRESTIDEHEAEIIHESDSLPFEPFGAVNRRDNVIGFAFGCHPRRERAEIIGAALVNNLDNRQQVLSGRAARE